MTRLIKERIYEMLFCLRNDWNLVVFSWDPSSSGLEDRKGVKEVDSCEDEERELMLKMQFKITRHFARMRFQQAGNKKDQFGAWYMTSVTYFGVSYNSLAQEPSSIEIMNKWKTKKQIESLDINVPPQSTQIDRS